MSQASRPTGWSPARALESASSYAPPHAEAHPVAYCHEDSSDLMREAAFHRHEQALRLEDDGSPNAAPLDDYDCPVYLPVDCYPQDDAEERGIHVESFLWGPAAAQSHRVHPQAMLEGVPVSHVIRTIHLASPSPLESLRVAQSFRALEQRMRPSWLAVASFLCDVCAFFRQGPDTLLNALECAKFSLLRRAVDVAASPRGAVSSSAAAAASLAVRGNWPAEDQSQARGRVEGWPGSGPGQSAQQTPAGEGALDISEAELLCCVLLSSKVGVRFL